MDQLVGASIFSWIDLGYEFYQLRAKAEDILKMALNSVLSVWGSTLWHFQKVTICDKKNYNL